MTATPAPTIHDAPEPVSRRRILTALAVPPAAWAIHEMACAATSGLLCLHDHRTAMRVTTLVLTAVGLGLCVASLAVAYASYRKLPETTARRTAAMLEDEGDAWRAMLTLAGMFVGVVFTLGLVWAGMSAVIFGSMACEVTR